MHVPGDSGDLSTVEYVLLCYRYTSVNIDSIFTVVLFEVTMFLLLEVSSSLC